MSSPTQEASGTAPSPHAWAAVVIFTLAYVIGFVDRIILSALVEPIKEDWGLSDTQISILNLGFSLFYALSVIPFGWLVDRWSRKGVAAGGLFLWTGATIASGVAPAFGWLLAARIAIGVGEATTIPAAHSWFGAVFPRNKVPLAFSIMQSGATTGTSLALLFGGMIYAWFLAMGVEESTGLRAWQWTFIAVGLPGIFIGIALLMLREPPKVQVEAGEDWSQFFDFYRAHWRIALGHHLGYVMLLIMGYAVSFWGVAFLMRMHGQPVEVAGPIWGILNLCAGVPGVLLSGWLSSRLIASGQRDGVFLVSAGAGLLAMLCVVAFTNLPTSTLFWVMVGAHVFFINAPFGPAIGAINIIAPPKARAKVGAIFGISLSALGMGGGPLLLGIVSDNIFPGQIDLSMLWVSVISAILGVVILLLTRRPYRELLHKIELEEQAQATA